MSRTRTPAWVWFALPAAAVVVYLVLSVVAAGGREAPADALPVVARVLKTEEAFCLVGIKRHSCLRLQLELHEVGMAPRSAELTVNVEDRWASRVQPGSWLQVRVAREPARDVYLDVAAFAEPPPTAP